MKKLIQVLEKAGKPTRLYQTEDGSSVLLLPYGGRVLGLYPPRSVDNFYWTHTALESAATAKAFYASKNWHNSGGDRTWLAPEADFFFPNFPKLDVYFQPRSLDPGQYRVRRSGTGFELTNRLRVTPSRLRNEITLQITKRFGAAVNPLRHERGLDLAGLEYAGYTQYTSLELVGSSRSARVQVGLWNLVQMPHGGDLLIPTFSRNEPRHIFSTVGTIPARDLITTEHLIRYRMRQKGEHKISVRAASVCGRVGYVYPAGNKWALIVRNFIVNPSGEYVDVPWTETDYFGFAIQACNVNSGLGAFSELEYHIPAIGHRTGRTRCDDEAQIWAFRGGKEQILHVCRFLLG